MITKKFDYKALSRHTSPNGRLYETPTGEKLPSVTTILDKTTDKTFLFEWKKRVGEEEAQRITSKSLRLGSEMHKMLEDYVEEDKTPDGSVIATAMANKIINEGLVNVSEFWGMEVPLWCPNLYAGTTDCVGVWKNKEAIIDFKNSRSLKKKEWIGNYLEQLTAYAIAHNDVYGTNIQTGVIMLSTHDGHYQEFSLEGDDFKKVSVDWANRVNTYYS